MAVLSSAPLWYGSRAAAEQLRQDLALPLERLALPFEGLAQGLALPFEGLALPFEGLALPFKGLAQGLALPFEGTGALPHGLGQYINFLVAPTASLPHLDQAPENRAQAKPTEAELCPHADDLLFHLVFRRSDPPYSTGSCG